MLKAWVFPTHCLSTFFKSEFKTYISLACVQLILTIALILLITSHHPLQYLDTTNFCNLPVYALLCLSQPYYVLLFYKAVYLMVIVRITKFFLSVKAFWKSHTEYFPSYLSEITPGFAATTLKEWSWNIMDSF